MRKSVDLGLRALFRYSPPLISSTRIEMLGAVRQFGYQTMAVLRYNLHLSAIAGIVQRETGDE